VGAASAQRPEAGPPVSPGSPRQGVAGRSIGFAWRSLVRQPARGGLAVLGVAAIGALLFDMLMLSQGLVTSMRDLLDRTGWDVRVMTTDESPGRGPRIIGAVDAAKAMAALPPVRAALAVRSVDANVVLEGSSPYATLQGITAAPRPPWTLLRGRDVDADDEVVINERLASGFRIGVGDPLTLQASCLDSRESLPSITFRVAGVAEFPIEVSSDLTIAGTLAGLIRACGGNARDEADLILVASKGDAQAAADAIGSAFPELRARTNEQLLGRLQQNGFSYFRQISTVLTSVTLAFALLLITVLLTVSVNQRLGEIAALRALGFSLLTVSVNQRLGEIAALRALGFSRHRVIADVLAESALIVGAGGAVSLPLGLLLARGLDRILTSMPGLPAGLHFFVFEPAALLTHILLLVITAFTAALYPMRIVARLPIAATLRDEVIG
jgi:putative ABC transport system permease protein